MIIENRALCLARRFALSRYNHRAMIITLKASSFQNGSQIFSRFGVGNLSIILFSRRFSPDPGSASDWSWRVGNLIQLIRSTIWVVTGNQYGISALVSQTSFGGETSGCVAICWVFSQATTWAIHTCTQRLFTFDMGKLVRLRFGFAVPVVEKRPRRSETGIKDGFEKMEHEFPFVIFRPEKQNYLFRFSVRLPKIFRWDNPKRRVLFTFQTDFSETFSKW